ncbi:hypothetical protein ABZT17_16760 [Streptomyces sp. NPDC005648]|uniref:hypothetical protein n=1 Tax=Streptomyces sp. NPDC005648 TaxID=3157044 RepID=UPI0033B5C69B
MVVHPWFEIDDPDDEFEFTEAERAFAGALGARCAEWASEHPGVYGDIHRPDDWGALLASVSLSDGTKPRLSLIDLGVHLVGDRVRGDRLHNQLYLLPDTPSPWALDATGPTDRLADLTADWFRHVLDKPVVLYVWLHEGYAYAARYAYADTGETLAQTYASGVAPPGQEAELTAAGQVRGRGWIQTVGLPTPALYLHVRGDLTKGRVIEGVPAKTGRGPLPGVWYE